MSRAFCTLFIRSSRYKNHDIKIETSRVLLKCHALCEKMHDHFKRDQFIINHAELVM